MRYFDELELRVCRIGLEAGPLSHWLRARLIAAGRDVVLLETRHVKAALSAMTVKTDWKMCAGSLNCCGWAGIGRFMQDRWHPRTPVRFCRKQASAGQAARR